MTTIFLSYARDDDEPFVRRLFGDLTAHGFAVWFDRVSMPSRQLTFYQEIRDAIAAADRLVLILGPGAATSDYVKQEWNSALEMGKCVNPIARLNGQRDDGGIVVCYTLVPDELAFIHAEDFRDDSRYAEHLSNLIRQLSDPAPPLGKLVAVPGLPRHYIGQPTRLVSLKEALLIDLQRPVVVLGGEARVGVQGMGGIGKSVLAAALARDIEVRRVFPDGVFWIGVGQQPNLVELQRFIAAELGDEALFNDLRAGKQKLKELLAERSALLILDDVWQSPHANAFDVLGPRCKLILTTRDAGLVSTMAGVGYQVQLPTEAEALALLASAARVPVESLPTIAGQIVDECGRLPLALALCGGMAYKGHLWERILRSLRDARLELIADRHEIEEHHRSIWRTMDISVQALSRDEQGLFAELAVFATGTSVPEEPVLTLWAHSGGLDELSAADLLVTLSERSLVRLDRSVGDKGEVKVRVSLHDLLHDYATRLAAQLLGSGEALHDRLLNAYRQTCRGGWPSGPNDGYYFQHLRNHFILAGRSDELIELLLDLRWLEAKASVGLVLDLPADLRDTERDVRVDHPKRRFLPLLGEALRRDVHFIARHHERYPQALFQCLWNASWWYDSPQAERHFEPPKHGWTVDMPPWDVALPKLSDLVAEWRENKELETPGFHWVRARRPLQRQIGGLRKAVVRGHKRQITGVALSPDCRQAITAGFDHTIRVWDVASGTETACLIGHTGPVISIVYVAEHRWIVSGSWDQTVRVWDAAAGTELRCMRGHDGGVFSVACSADGSRIVSSGEDKTVRVWDERAGEELRCLRGHSDRVRSVACSLDGRLAVSGADDHTVRVWDIESGELLSCLSGHGDSVRRMAIDAEARRVVTRSWDETVRVWEIKTGQCVEVLPGRDDLAGIAAGALSFPFRPMTLVQESAIEVAETGELIAWIPTALRSTKTSAAGRTWVGSVAAHLYVFTLEGDLPGD